MRAVAVALVASSALATQYATFSPYLDVYTNGADCTSTTPVLTVDGVQSGALACQKVPNTNWYVKLPACDVDANPNGPAPCFSYMDAQCGSCDAGPSTFLFSTCSTTAVNSTITYVSKCNATPCCATAGWVVTFAVLLSLATVGLCAFWGWKDQRAKIRAKADAASLQASVEAEEAKANAVSGFSFGAGAGAPAVHGGYNAMH